jgi:hypothetical protein
MIEVLRGNRVILRYQLYTDGVRIQDLAAATRAVFAMKTNQEDLDEDSVVYVEKGMTGTGSAIEIDTPDIGSVRVVLDAPTMVIPAGRYHYALQVEWGSDNKLEFTYGDGIIQVNQDTVR